MAECRDCSAERTRRWREAERSKEIIKGLNLLKFGITLDDYNRMKNEQSNVCKICGKEETAIRLGKLKDLAVDHCHKTGKVRGLLCSKCNVGLGHFDDNTELLQSAIEYLRGSS